MHQFDCLKINMAGHQNDINSFPFHELLDPSGKLWASFYRVDNRYLLRFTGFADFTISSDGLEIIANPVQGVSEQTVEHLYLNVALPLAFSRQLKLVLHASAVEMDNTAVAFLGVSGRGKSTLAASFSTSGFRFLTDDGLQLEPGAGGRFAPSAYSGVHTARCGSGLHPQGASAGG